MTPAQFTVIVSASLELFTAAWWVIVPTVLAVLTLRACAERTESDEDRACRERGAESAAQALDRAIDSALRQGRPEW